MLLAMNDRRAFETDYELFRDGCSRQWCKSGLCLTRYHSYTTTAELKTASSTASSTATQIEIVHLYFHRIIDRFQQYSILSSLLFEPALINPRKNDLNDGRFEKVIRNIVYVCVEIARLLVSLWSNKRSIPASSRCYLDDIGQAKTRVFTCRFLLFSNPVVFLG